MTVKINLYFSIITLLFLQIPSFTTAGESCYEMGYRYGLCSTKALLGLECKTENDIVIPEKCREEKETTRGIKDGIEAVYDALNLKK